MGHTRLGAIPKSRKWTAIVQDLASAAQGMTEGSYSGYLHENVEDVAKDTLEAAQGGLNSAIDDIGLRYTFYLLSQIALASREENWQERLSTLGIDLESNSSLLDLSSEMQAAIDTYLTARNRATDISEMAQRSAGEALVGLAENRATTLFGSDLEDVRLSIRDLSTKKGFSDLGQRFFGLFLTKFLNFYLSRITANQINTYNLPQIGDVTKFNDELQLHCQQTARIVRDFCGEWYSKTEYLEGIDIENTAGFVAVALKKLRAELRKQEEEL